MILKKLKIFIFILVFSIIKVYSEGEEEPATPQENDSVTQVPLQSCTPSTSTTNNNNSGRRRESTDSTTFTSGKYCIDGSVIKIITNNGVAGSTKFGKSGPTGNFFFDANMNLMTSGDDNTNIGSIYSCDSSGCTLVSSSENNDKTYFNSKATSMSCVYSKGGKCQKGESNKSYFDSYTNKVIICSNNKCTLSSSSGYYINYGISDNDNKITNLVTCNNNSCSTEDLSKSTSESGGSGGGSTGSGSGENTRRSEGRRKRENKYESSKFYINSGPDKSSKPIIYFGADSKLKTISGEISGVFLDTGTLTSPSSEYTSNVIVCSSSNKCTSVKYESGIFLNAAKKHKGIKDENEAQLIECSATGCKSITIESEEEGSSGSGDQSSNLYYLDGLTKKLIQCSGTTSVECSLYDKSTSGKYYLDYSTESSSEECPGEFCSLNVISCNSSSHCSSTLISTDSQFIDGDTDENIIICASFGTDFFCTNAKAENLTYYYINSGNKGDRPLLYCGEDDKTKSCVATKASTLGYYMTDNSNTIAETYKQDYNGYLISCSSTTKCELSTDKANDGFYVNAGVSVTNKPLIFYESENSHMEEVDPEEKDTYYLDSSSLVAGSYLNLIYCSTIKSCVSIEPSDGYYYNEGPDDGADEIIIKCDKAGCNVDESVQYCSPNEETILSPGNYCFQRVSDTGKDINLVVKEFIVNSEGIDATNQNNITYTSSGTIFKYVSVTAGNFPGITNSISTLFEIRPRSITRVISDSIYIINSKNEQVKPLTGSINIEKTSSYSMYMCSSSTQLCVKSQECKPGLYFFDELNKIGYQCNGLDISPISEAGFYVDSSYNVKKSITPSVMKCQDNGYCERYTPKNTYFVNAGYDNTTKPLIYCSSSSCRTQEAAIGYYIAEFGQSGVIVCTSSTLCKISSLRYNYYINSGADKATKPIIACNKSVNCKTKKAYIGYYLVQENNSLLINCKMATTCQVEEGALGYYFNAVNYEASSDNETIIKCYTSTYTNDVICVTEKKNKGFYLSGSNNNILVNCMDSRCKTTVVENGIFRSAATIKTSVKYISTHGRDSGENGDEVIDRVGRFEVDDDTISKESNVMLRHLVENQAVETKKAKDQLVKRANKKNEEPVSTLIICNGGVCNELTAEELNFIPVCTYSNDLCYIDNSNLAVTSQNKIITSVFAGDYCTDSSRSTIYFATETIVEYNDVISGVLSSSKSTNKNCIKASAQYSSNLFTVGNSIFKVNDGLVMEIYDTGYYFIDISKNILVHGTEIKDYNSSNVLLYKCDGKSCRVMDKPTSDTYYTDVSKRIIKYSYEENKYSYINKKENICMFADNKCTPKYDIEENEFCVTAEGNIVVAGEKIKSRETGKCFMSTSITENALAYSFNSVLYFLNSNAAKQVVTSGYYFADNNKYYNVEYKAFNTTTAGITLYGCITKNCQIYEPEPNVYYFDMLTNYLIQKKDKFWISPNEVGYIYTSVSPEEKYIYTYTLSENNELLLKKTNEDGWYYTIDNKMYQCNTAAKTCTEIQDSGYIFTKSNEIYYCVVDSEGEETECFKKTCTIGQIYYVKDNYYKCAAGSKMELIRSRHCDHDEVVIINFPLIYSEDFPENVYTTINNIAKNNHHLPTQKVTRDSLETVQGVFTNCTYNLYDDYANYDQICMENYVKLNVDNEPDICSVKLLGYTFCTVEDGDNPDKCNPSSALKREYLSLWHIIKLIASIVIILIIF